LDRQGCAAAVARRKSVALGAGSAYVKRNFDSKAVAMTDRRDQTRLTKGRIFLLIFFGLAIVLSITTILGTWDEQKNGVISPEEMKQLTEPSSPTP
jgi:hypothetical protein